MIANGISNTFKYDLLHEYELYDLHELNELKENFNDRT